MRRKLNRAREAKNEDFQSIEQEASGPVRQNDTKIALMIRRQSVVEK